MPVLYIALVHKSLRQISNLVANKKNQEQSY
jgi:hypothetical protein